MTEDELFALWARWAHRADLEVDLPMILTITRSRIEERALLPVDLDALLESQPRMLIHGGLGYIHELARDLEGQQLEEARFEQAVQDWHLSRSRALNATVDPFTYTQEVPTNGT